MSGINHRPSFDNRSSGGPLRKSFSASAKRAQADEAKRLEAAEKRRSTRAKIRLTLAEERTGEKFKPSSLKTSEENRESWLKKIWGLVLTKVKDPRKAFEVIAKILGLKKELPQAKISSVTGPGGTYCVDSKPTKIFERTPGDKAVQESNTVNQRPSAEKRPSAAAKTNSVSAQNPRGSEPSMFSRALEDFFPGTTAKKPAYNLDHSLMGIEPPLNDVVQWLNASLTGNGEDFDNSLVGNISGIFGELPDYSELPWDAGVPVEYKSEPIGEDVLSWLNEGIRGLPSTECENSLVIEAGE